jgi:hypothetical protein
MLFQPHHHHRRRAKGPYTDLAEKKQILKLPSPILTA